VTSTKKLSEDDVSSSPPPRSGEEEAVRHLSGEQRIDLRQEALGKVIALSAGIKSEKETMPPPSPNQTRQSEKFRIPDEARRSTLPPHEVADVEVEVGKATTRVEIPESIKQLSLPTPGRAMNVAEVAAMIQAGMEAQERELSPTWNPDGSKPPTRTPIVVPAAPRVPTVEVKEEPPQTILTTVKVGRRRFSPILIKLREIASAFLLFVALLAISLGILRAIVAVLFR
jgi:hypothetical protein